tara:strand:+ start:40 stop:303 length:264 start_codon:yes stop_codon:yes gene_type:complete
MCVGNKPKAPKPQPPAPTMKAAAPPPVYVKPEDIRGDDLTEDEKLTNKRKKALEVQAAKEGTKQLSAIDPSAGTNLPQTPAGGTNVP